MVYMRWRARYRTRSLIRTEVDSMSLVRSLESVYKNSGLVYMGV